MRNIKNHLLKTAKRIKHFARPLAIPEKYMHKNVPYFSQWESPKLARSILSGEISTDDDPNWRASGAKNKAEYHNWSWSGCGMACTKMILAHRTGEVVPLVTLGKKCAEYGGYTFPIKTSPGLFYKPYVTFVAKELGWQAKVIQGASVDELMYEISQGNYVIVSVNPQIRSPKSTPKTKSGHLVLLVGYDRDKQAFYLHNPSGISKDTQEYATIKIADFKRFFGGRGIVIQGNSPK